MRTKLKTRATGDPAPTSIVPPFPWDEERRHRLQCEIDAVFARMYRLDRSELAYILDAPPPDASFPALKRNEIAKYGEYRTKRHVLEAYDRLAAGAAVGE